MTNELLMLGLDNVKCDTLIFSHLVSLLVAFSHPYGMNLSAIYVLPSIHID